jgi:hypothetical protein
VTHLFSLLFKKQEYGPPDAKKCWCVSHNHEINYYESLNGMKCIHDDCGCPNYGQPRA